MKGIWNGKRFITDNNGLPVVGDDGYLLNIMSGMIGSENLEIREICNDKDLLSWVRANIKTHQYEKPIQTSVYDLLKIIDTTTEGDADFDQPHKGHETEYGV